MTMRQHKDMALSFAFVSASAARNRLQAARAKAQDDILLEHLFNAIAQSQEIHARRILMHLRGKIEEAEPHIEGLMTYQYEAYNNNYPELSRDAAAADKKSLAELFDHLSEVTKIQHGLLNRFLKKELDASTDFYVCSVCGHIAIDGIPERCPVCNAVPGRFKTL